MGFLGIFSLIVLTTLGATVIGVVVWLAMLPGKIAFKREHPQAEAIRMAGWLGILTGIVWILALIWSYTRVGEGLGEEISQRLEILDKRLALVEGRDGISRGGSS